MTSKIIIIADWIIDYVTKEPYMFANELHAHHGWTIIKLSMLNMEEVKQRKSIVLCITYDNLDISVLRCENITLVYKVDDLYPYTDIRKKCIDYADLIISPYQYLFKEEKIIQMYPSVKSKESYHIPYSAVDTFYKNIEFNNTPKEKIFVSGAVSDVYPLRQYILRYKEYIETLEHPTYNNYTHNIINEKYYNKLSEYLCCFSDALIYKYVLLKVFEICSVGSLLLCDELIQDELYRMGFENNVNYISCNKENLESKMKWILDKNNREIVDEIRLKGMTLVRNNHNTNNRSEAFNSLVNNKYFTDNENKAVFENIYNNKLWNDGRTDIPLSGPGSSLENTKQCSSVLNKFIYDNNCKSVLDLGCGDLTWISKTPFFNDTSIKYTGVDVVESLITSHSTNYPENTFICKDLVKYDNNIEFTSLIIIRDVIFHLKNNEILSIFENIKNKFDFLLITSCKNDINTDNFDKWHFSNKNIHKKPFHKSHDFEININEPVFNRTVYIYTHDNFYTPSKI